MSGTVAPKEHRLLEKRPRLLAQFFEKSRDKWKQKYQQAKAQVRAFRDRIRDLEISRATWRDKAEKAQSEQQRLQEQVQQLQEQLAAAEAIDKKKRTDP